MADRRATLQPLVRVDPDRGLQRVVETTVALHHTRRSTTRGAPPRGASLRSLHSSPAPSSHPSGDSYGGPLGITGTSLAFRHLRHHLGSAQPHGPLHVGQAHRRHSERDLDRWHRRRGRASPTASGPGPSAGPTRARTPAGRRGGRCGTDDSRPPGGAADRQDPRLPPGLSGSPRPARGSPPEARRPRSPP